MNTAVGRTATSAEAVNNRNRGLTLKRRRSRTMVQIGLAIILLLAAGFRFFGLNWDDGHHLHPDERFLTMVTTAVKWPASVGEYLDEPRSPLNPRNVGFNFFGYGALPVGIVKGLALLTGLDNYDRTILVGRVVSAFFDLGTIVLLFFMAKALYRDNRIGLLAALLYAGAVAAIQHSHFYVVDPFANFFITATLLFLAKFQVDGRIRNCLLSGAALGLAMASKIPAGVLVPLALVVAVQRAIWQTRRSQQPLRSSLQLESSLLRFAICCMAALVTFRLAEPDAFRGSELWGVLLSDRWLANMREVVRMSNGEIDWPPGHQWTGRIPLLFPWINMSLWGTGPPLGIVGWAGWAAAVWRMIVRREAKHLIPTVWVAGVFLVQGTQWNMTMRYFLPAYGCTILLGAWLMIRWSDLAKRRAKRGPQPLIWRLLVPHAVTAGLIIGTFLWAAAFSRIYARPHTRVQASEWIYANIPAGSSLGNEHWDDALPLPTGGRRPFPDLFNHVEMRWYNEDKPEKLQDALGWLDRADYIILSSNRLYGSIPRLPARFPMTVRYYRALFDGALGFERVADFQSEPSLLGVEIPTQTAEEAFTVYDHPRVQIFRKTAQYRRDKAEVLLGAVNWDEIVAVPAFKASRAPTAFMLPADRWEQQKRSGTWNRIYASDWARTRAPCLIWVSVLVLIGFISWPYLFLACPGLPDRAWGFSRILGILLATWLVWLAASTGLGSFTSAWIWGTLLFLALGAAWIVKRNYRAMRLFLASGWRLLLVSEMIFFAGFALLALIRTSNPDLWHSWFGGEKPMDLAYLSAVVKSSQFPPYNPWFAGGFINYYYFGFALVGALIHATGIVPEVSYNLVLVTFFALAGTGAFSVTYALAGSGRETFTKRRVLLSMTGVVLVLWIGNLKQIQLILAGLAKAGAGEAARALPAADYLLAAIRGLFRCLYEGWSSAGPLSTWYIDATRAISHAPGESGPITEFPFFTFLYGDLHAHLLGLPLLLLVVALALNIARLGAPARSSGRWSMALLGLVCGAVWAVNSWDGPTCLTIAGVGLVIRQIHQQQMRRPTPGVLIAARAFWQLLLVAAVGYACIYPFHYWMQSGYGAFETWKGSRTPVSDYLLIYGVFLFAIIPGMALFLISRRYQPTALRPLALAIRYRRRRTRLESLRLALVGARIGYGLRGAVALCALVVGAFIFVDVARLPVLILLLLACATLAWSGRRRSPEDRFALALAIIAWSLTLAVEFFVLKGDVSRMNTVFKFSFQAWVLLGLAAVVLISHLVEEIAEQSLAKRVYLGGLAVLISAGLLFPLTAVPAKWSDRFASLPRTWNGMAFMEQATHSHDGKNISLQPDLEAIRWLRANVQGTPVIAEINTQPILYGWGNRMSIYTGLPSIVGWDWHLRQQMAFLPVERVAKRIDLVKEIYNSPDGQRAWDLLRRYNAEWIVVGELERVCATTEGIAKFQAGRGKYWDLAFQRPGISIYHVRGAE